MLKKKLLVGVLCITIMTIAFGCGKKTEKQEGETGTTEQTPDSEETTSKIEYNVDDYVKLGNYMGIEVAKEEAEVTDEDMKTAINNILASYPETVKTDKQVVEDGDTVNMDYEGLLNDEAFEGGTGQDYNLVIGSDSFIDGFEEGVIGAKVGDTVDVNVSFPENYGNEKLNGQAVVFKVKVNYIGEQKTPELTEEFIKTYTQKEMTIEEFQEQLKTELLEEKKTTIENNKIVAVQTAVLENSTVSEFPEGLLEEYIEEEISKVKADAESSELELAEYLAQYEMKEDELNENISAYAEEYFTKLFITEAITKKEDLAITDKEYQTAAEEYATTNQSTVEDLENQIGKAKFKEMFQWQKTWNYVADASVEK